MLGLLETGIVDNRSVKEHRLLGVDPFGPAIVGKALSLDDAVRLAGPLYLGNGVRISRGTIVEGACLYDGAIVEAAATVSHSVVLEEARAGKDSEARDSVLSRACVVEEDAHLSGSIIGDGMTVKGPFSA